MTLAPAVEFKNGGQEGTHSAFASALSFGLAPGETPVYLPEAVSRNIHWEPGTSLGCTQPNCARPIAPLATSFCYLSSVSGAFNGGGEWVQVLPDAATGQWLLAANSNSGNGVSARAECVVMNQVR